MVLIVRYFKNQNKKCFSSKILFFLSKFLVISFYRLVSIRLYLCPLHSIILSVVPSNEVEERYGGSNIFVRICAHQKFCQHTTIPFNFTIHFNAITVEIHVKWNAIMQNLGCTSSYGSPSPISVVPSTMEKFKIFFKI